MSQKRQLKALKYIHCENNVSTFNKVLKNQKRDEKYARSLEGKY